MARNSDGIECPFCEHVHHAEPEDAGKDMEFEMDCEECGKVFVMWAEISVDYVTRVPRGYVAAPETGESAP